MNCTSSTTEKLRMNRDFLFQQTRQVHEREITSHELEQFKYTTRVGNLTSVAHEEDFFCWNTNPFDVTSKTGAGADAHIWNFTFSLFLFPKKRFQSHCLKDFLRFGATSTKEKKNKNRKHSWPAQTDLHQETRPLFSVSREKTLCWPLVWMRYILRQSVYPQLKQKKSTRNMYTMHKIWVQITFCKTSLVRIKILKSYTYWHWCQPQKPVSIMSMFHRKILDFCMTRFFTFSFTEQPKYLANQSALVSIQLR